MSREPLLNRQCEYNTGGIIDTYTFDTEGYSTEQDASEDVSIPSTAFPPQ